MTTYYKATRPNGRDFATDTIDYGAALLSGEVIRHPSPKKVRNDASTYLSVSVSAADCTGFSWPCRLFRVEPIGRSIKATDLPNKRCVSALRVVEELPAWQAFGPNGEAVAALVERAKRLTLAETRDLAAAWVAAWNGEWNGARNGAWNGEWNGARNAAWNAAFDAAWNGARNAAWNATRNAVWDAARACVVRDLITPEQFDVLYGPWAKVIG